MTDVDVTALINGAKQLTGSVTVYLAGDLIAEYEELKDQLAAGPGADSLDGGDAAARTQRMATLREQMAGTAVKIRMQAMGRVEYDELLGEHPPRRDENGDVLPADLAGFNSRTFYSALIRACWASPVLDDAVRDRMLDVLLTNRQYDEVAMKALEVNRGKVDIPFSLAASRLLTTSGDE